MLALAPDLPTLSAGERFALDLLLDLSRALRVDGASAVDASLLVRLQVAGTPSPGDDDIVRLRARGWGISAADGGVTLDRPLLQMVHRVAGAVAEQKSTATDRFGRVPPSENALVQAGLERDPVVSSAARALAEAIVHAAGRRRALFLAPWPSGRRWAAALTHDLDVVQWWPAFTALRLAELAKKGELSSLVRVLGAVVRSVGRDVVWHGVRDVLATEQAHGLRSSWFVLCGSPTFDTMRAGDLTYRAEAPLARRILDALRAGGHEVGLHGSFASSERHALFAEQRSRLATLTRTPVRAVRQHYLRMRPGATHRRMSEAGFTLDSTYGFADRNGFRLGVADVVPAWDELTSSTLALDEAPFTWMDRALSKYAGVERPDVWIDDALELAEQVRRVEGMWVGIWHPNLTPALGYPGAPAAYARLVGSLVERGAWIAPLGDIAAWRRARRSARAVAIDAGGAVSLSVSERTPHDLAIESATGQPVEAHVGR